MEKVFVPVRVTEQTKDFIIYNVVASEKRYWSEKDLQEMLKEHNIFLSLKEVTKEITELVSNGLLIVSYENNGRGLVYKWKDWFCDRDY